VQSSQKSTDFLSSPEATQVLTLVELFSLTSFYPYQKKIINAVLDKQDCIVVQSTGSGKSLCFQFPPVYLQKKAVVIMPTISLMRDQTIQVNEYGIKVAYMGSATKYQSDTIAALSPTSDTQIIFVTPEWLFTEQLDNMSKLKVLEQADRLSLIAIDEAHLIYEWHSFRPMYMHCQELPSAFPSTPIMTLSATVTPEIMTKLQSFLRNPVVEKGSVYRHNIFLEAIHCTFKLGKESQGNAQCTHSSIIIMVIAS